MCGRSLKCPMAAGLCVEWPLADYRHSSELGGLQSVVMSCVNCLSVCLKRTRSELLQ